MSAKETKQLPAEPGLSAWSPLTSLRHEIDDLFDNFHRGEWLDPMRYAPARLRRQFGGSNPAFMSNMPRLDLIEKENEYKMIADLPGLTEKDINIEVSDDLLKLTGEKKEEREEGDENSDFHVCERRFGSFSRVVRMPEGIDQSKVEATVKNGVLTIRLPKKPEARHPKKTVKVKAV